MWSQIFHTGAQAQQSLEQLRREDGVEQLLLGFILSCHIPQHGQVSTAQLPNPALGLLSLPRAQEHLLQVCLDEQPGEGRRAQGAHTAPGVADRPGPELPTALFYQLNW